MRISLIHPSRSRPQMAFDNYKNWLTKSYSYNSGLSNISIEHILSLDLDEPKYDEYVKLFGTHHIVRENPSDGYVVGATNAAAKHATGDILIYLSDDFDCPQNWDVSVSQRLDITKPQILKVYDCVHDIKVGVLTIPIITKAWYDKFGYFFYPEYKSMFCDEDLYNVAVRENALVIAKDLTFPHLHPSNHNAQASNDPTYARSSAMWEQGKAIHQRRRLNNYQ